MERINREKFMISKLSNLFFLNNNIFHKLQTAFFILNSPSYQLYSITLYIVLHLKKLK